MQLVVLFITKISFMCIYHLVTVKLYARLEERYYDIIGYNHKLLAIEYDL